jgi:hypothetical protein
LFRKTAIITLGKLLVPLLVPLLMPLLVPLPLGLAQLQRV